MSAPEDVKGEQMGGHTPGPWTIEEWGRFYQIGPSPLLVCEVPKSGAAGAEANARLIAKAPLLPEMAEALRELVERCDGEEGARADGSNIQTMRAHAILARYEEQNNG